MPKRPIFNELSDATWTPKLIGPRPQCLSMISRWWSPRAEGSPHRFTIAVAHRDKPPGVVLTTASRGNLPTGADRHSEWLKLWRHATMKTVKVMKHQKHLSSSKTEAAGKSPTFAPQQLKPSKLSSRTSRWQEKWCSCIGRDRNMQRRRRGTSPATVSCFIGHALQQRQAHCMHPKAASSFLSIIVVSTWAISLTIKALLDSLYYQKCSNINSKGPDTCDNFKDFENIIYPKHFFDVPLPALSTLARHIHFDIYQCLQVSTPGRVLIRKAFQSFLKNMTFSLQAAIPYRRLILQNWATKLL